MHYRDPKPEVLRIEELVSRVKDGDIKLPKFQRSFVWKRDDILNLCDSVYRSYPIGSILLWLTREKLTSERRIGDLDISERSEEYPVNYLLDGQQRLSTLCGALYWKGEAENKKSDWNIWFDLEKEEFFHPSSNTKIEQWHFPMNELLDTLDFNDRCQMFKNHPKAEEYKKNSRRLLESIKDYKIAVVTIGDMKLDEVAPIFERINSTGRSLTMVDLMRAATWKGDFDLSDAISSIQSALRDKQFDSIEDTDVLKSLSACNGNGFLKEDIDKLRSCDSSKLKSLVVDCKNAYKLAVDFLTQDLPLESHAYLPYKIQINLLAEFFRICPNPSLSQRKTLQKWFWKTSFSRFFTATNYSSLREYLREIRSFAENKESTLSSESSIDLKFLNRDKFALNKAVSKTFGLLLASRKPYSLEGGYPLNLNASLSVANRYEYHHIFPKNYLANLGINKSKHDIHSNICLLTLRDNRSISNQAPSVYFKKLADELGDDRSLVFNSNFISDLAFQAALEDNYEEFIKIRSEDLRNAIENLTS
jgi:hypothetical protein